MQAVALAQVARIMAYTRSAVHVRIELAACTYKVPFHSIRGARATLFYKTVAPAALNVFGMLGRGRIAQDQAAAGGARGPSSKAPLHAIRPRLAPTHRRPTHDWRRETCAVLELLGWALAVARAFLPSGAPPTFVLVGHLCVEYFWLRLEKFLAV